MQRIEAMSAAYKVCGRLRRASDAGELEHALRLHAHFVHRIDYTFRNGIVPASGAKRGLASTVIDNLQPEPVGLGRRSGSWGGRHELFPFLGDDVISHGARVYGQAVEMAHAAQP